MNFLTKFYSRKFLWLVGEKVSVTCMAKSGEVVDVYGKNLIPMEKLYNLWVPWPPGSYAFVVLC